MDIIMNDAGYVKLDGKTGSNNGFDGLYIKESPNNITEIVVGEAKPWNSGISLNEGTSTLPSQMSDAWIDNVINRMGTGGNSEVADLLSIAANRAKIVKIVTTVDKTTGEIKILKLGAF